MPSDEIRPCPFCGCRDLEIVNYGYKDGRKVCFRVQCMMCRAQGPVGKSVRLAARLWSTRAGAGGV